MKVRRDKEREYMALIDYFRDDIEEAEKRGEARGEARGKAEARCEFVDKLIAEESYSLERACEFVDVPLEEYQEYKLAQEK